MRFDQAHSQFAFLTLKVPVIIPFDNMNSGTSYISEKMRLDIIYELSPWADESHEIYSLIFFEKKKEKKERKHVICYSFELQFKG